MTSEGALVSFTDFELEEQLTWPTVTGIRKKAAARLYSLSKEPEWLHRQVATFQLEIRVQSLLSPLVTNAWTSVLFTGRALCIEGGTHTSLLFGSWRKSLAEFSRI